MQTEISIRTESKYNTLCLMKVSDSCSHDGENSQIGMSAFRVSSLTAYLERVEKFMSGRNKEGMSLKSQAQTK